jgi:porphobilinogen synthase
MRRLVAETTLAPHQLVLPMFVREGARDPRPVPSMPGVVQHTRDTLRKAALEAVEAGVGGLMLFGVPETRDETGSAGLDPDGVLNVAIRDVVAEVGDATVVMADLCLDEFTSHGHCGVLAPDGSVDNDATLGVYEQMALAQAAAGAHLVGLSGGGGTRGPGPRRVHGRRDSRLRGQVRVLVLWPVPRRRRVGPAG